MVSQHYSVFIILLLVIAVNSCIRDLPESSPNIQDKIERGMQVIVPGYRFECCGKVAEWKIRVPITTKKFNNIVELQVWRLTTSGPRGPRGPRCYSLHVLGNNTFTNFSSVNGIATLHPQPDHQIQVKPDDVIGLYVYSGSSSYSASGAVVTTNAEGAWLVHATKAKHACFQRQRRRPAPAVAASLVSTGSCSTTVHSSSADSPRSNTGMIVGTTVAGLLIALLLLIGAIIIALLIAIKQRVTRHFTSPSFLRLQREQEMANNHCEFSTSYSYVRHCSEESIAIQENQAYNKIASNQDTAYYETYY